MDRSTLDETGAIYRLTLPVLLGIGVVGVVVFLYMFLSQHAAPGTAVPDQLTEIMLLGLPAIGLCYVGYWLHSCELSEADVWRIGQYALGGVAVGFLVGAGLIVGLPVTGIGTAASFFYFVSAATEGALLGFLVGTITVTDVLSQHRQDLEQRSERLEERLATASHDLRNPLNIARGRLSLVQEECDSEHLEAVDRAHDRMEQLIEDLLTLTQLRDATTTVESVPFTAVVENSWQTVETADATLVKPDVERSLRADRGKLQQLLENLFRNAVEHGGEDVTITVGVLDDGFYVADDGPGIPAAEREEVFETGYSTNTDGTGFGLSIVEQIAELHGWAIDVSESADGGARFDITRVTFAER